MGRKRAETQKAARFLSDAADYFQIKGEQVSGQNPEERELLRKNAEAFKALSRELGTPAQDLPDYRPAASLLWKNGPWLRRRKFLGPTPDRPSWCQPGVPRPNFLWTPIDDSTDEWKALAALFKETSRGLEATDRAHIARPAFLPGVTLAHVERPGDIVWDALFSIVLEEEPKGEGNAEAKKELRARSFDFASAEVHRLNAITPVNTVGHELAYLRYFMSIVRGDLGAFYLLEGRLWELVQPHLAAHIERDVETAKDFSIDAIHPPRFSYVAANGAPVYSTWILYSNDIFKAEIGVNPDGTVDMLDDQAQVGSISGLFE